MKEYIIPDDFLDYETMASADGQGFLRELVRCGECKHWEEKPLINGNGTRFGTCPLMMRLFFKSDFYCADGKRKDNETKLKGE